MIFIVVYVAGCWLFLTWLAHRKPRTPKHRRPPDH